MTLQNILSKHIDNTLKSMYKIEVDSIEFQASRKDFEGDITVVTFPILRFIKMNPVQLGESIGKYLVEHVDEVNDFNIVKGFLNIVISDQFYINFFNEIMDDFTFGIADHIDEQAIMVEHDRVKSKSF